MFDGPTSELLAIIVFPVLVGFFWLIVVATLRSPSVDQKELREHCVNSFALLSIFEAFDPDHAIVWQSQTPALRLIASGVSLSALCEFFGHFSSLYPELYEGIRFDEWLRFLQTCDLVARADCEVHLTSNGRQFLDYLERAGNESRPKHPVR